MRDVECGQNLLACLMLIRGDEGMDIDIREECDGEMGDGLEKDREAGGVFRCVIWGGTHAIGYETEEAGKKKCGGLSGLIKFGLGIVRWLCVDKLVSKNFRCDPLVRGGGDRDRYLRRCQHPKKKKENSIGCAL
jgi:hypothetical protein